MWYYGAKLWLFIFCIFIVIIGELTKKVLQMDFWNTQLSWITIFSAIIINATVRFIDKQFNKKIDKVKKIFVKNHILSSINYLKRTKKSIKMKLGNMHCITLSTLKL